MAGKKSLDKSGKKAHNKDMNSTKALVTQTATCPCGTRFEREVKRGRPQVWCATCMAIPFAKRGQVKAEQVLHEALLVIEAPAVVAERIVNANDALDNVREIIEAEMVKINAEHKARFAELVAEGMSPVDAGCQAAKETHVATLAVYAPFRKKTVTGSWSDKAAAAAEA